MKIMAKTGPIEFLKQVRSEAKKVTWPTRQETTVSTIAVFIMVFVASLFFVFCRPTHGLCSPFGYEHRTLAVTRQTREI
jgi:preprotein translocase subunit SecE